MKCKCGFERSFIARPIEEIPRWYLEREITALEKV